MRGEAMGRVCERLSRGGHALASYDALEFFAREGDWQTSVYAGRVASLEAWEVDAAFEANLRRNLPAATIRMVDSYAFGAAYDRRFDLIVVDNPQSCFGPDGCFCEHFEALPIALRLLKSTGLVVFNLNWAPFNFDAHPQWRERRAEYYGRADTARLSVEAFLLPFYADLFRRLGRATRACFSEPRNDQYLAYAVFELTAE